MKLKKTVSERTEWKLTATAHIQKYVQYQQLKLQLLVLQLIK